MDTIKQALSRLAEEQGFARTAFLLVKDLVFVEEYRRYCEENVCGNYGKLPNCPPACGTFAEMKEKACQYEHVFVMQTIQELDFSDVKAIKAAKARHNHMTEAVVDAIGEKGVKGLVMSAGPTRYSSCMSAYCVDACKMAEVCEMPYWIDDHTAAFFSQFLF